MEAVRPKVGFSVRYGVNAQTGRKMGHAFPKLLWDKFRHRWHIPTPRSNDSALKVANQMARKKKRIPTSGLNVPA